MAQRPAEDTKHAYARFPLREKKKARRTAAGRGRFTCLQKQEADAQGDLPCSQYKPGVRMCLGQQPNNCVFVDGTKAKPKKLDTNKSYLGRNALVFTTKQDRGDNN